MSIIYSVPKAGKTSILAQLEDNFILELEPGGADYISARVQEIYKAFRNLMLYWCYFSVSW